MDNLSQHIEALIFASESPISVKEIKNCLESIHKKELDATTIKNLVTSIAQKYKNAAFEIIEIAGGYQFLTKTEYAETINILIQQKSRKKLTRAALETLSVIAYKQPITKSEVEKIRGVNCDYAIRKLLEKELVQIKGRSKEVGRPLLYSTSDKFMEHFGLSSIKELPKLKEFKVEENQIGEENEL